MSTGLARTVCFDHWHHLTILEIDRFPLSLGSAPHVRLTLETVLYQINKLIYKTILHDQLEHVHSGYTGDDDESYDRYTDENRHFHCLIAEASGNHELATMLGRLHDWLAYFMVMRRAGRTMVSTHRRVIEAPRPRDVEAARLAMRDELDETHDAVLGRVIREEGAFWHLGVREDTPPQPFPRLTTNEYRV